VKIGKRLVHPSANPSEDPVDALDGRLDFEVDAWNLRLPRLDHPVDLVSGRFGAHGRGKFVVNFS